MQTRKKLLILDLDETLIHGSKYDVYFDGQKLEPDFHVEQY